MNDDNVRKAIGCAAPVAVDPFCLAAGLFRNDLAFTLPLAIVLALCGVLQEVFPTPGILAQAVLTCANRTLELVAMSCIVMHWRRKLEHPGGMGPRYPAIAGRIVLGGLAFSIALNASLQGAMLAPFPVLTSLCLMVFTIALFWAFRLYFYFAICGFLAKTVRESVRATYLITKQYPTAVIRSLVGPVGITVFLAALAAIPAPDGRSQAWGIVGVSLESVFWILATYTGIAFTLVLIDPSDWRAAGLDLYREERLKTLEMQGRMSWFGWLSPRHGLVALLFALCIWVSNMARMLNLPPSAQVKVGRCEAGDRVLSVSLELIDSEHSFRGFNPFAFSLASQTGFPVSTETEKVSLTPDGSAMSGREFMQLLTKGDGPITLHYRFRTNKAPESLVAMDNLWLWYNLRPLIRLAPVAHQVEDRSNP